MLSFERPKERILLVMSIIYLFSFSSLYVQLPGLFSRNGILPVDKLAIDPVNKPEEFLTNPNLLRLAHFLQLDNFDFLEIITVLGALFSLLAVIFESFRTVSTFALLWLCHFACYSAGQVFLQFQWDILLLEAGFLTVLLAQGDLIFIRLPKHVASDTIVIFLFKWLLFRLMFASGVVKLTSECPAWWSLKALNHHFETQCIPTPLAYFAHSLPVWILKLAVVGTYYLEIIAPLMFLIPLKGLRLFSFYTQIALQVSIILTGNYNFFNLLTIGLCYSLLTDCDFGKVIPAKLCPVAATGKVAKGKKQTAVAPKPAGCVMGGAVCHLLSVLIIFASLGLTAYLFKFNVKDNTIESSMGFDAKQFATLLKHTVTYSIYIAIASFVVVLYAALKSALTKEGMLKKTYNFIGVLVIALISTALFFASIVVFAHGVAPEVAKTQPAAFQRIYHQVAPFKLTHSYGLFRKMTTVRNEVILEYAESDKGPWTKIDFMHKPGEATKRPPFIAPHQPRLDWQMWFAALSKPEQNGWLYSVINGILEGRVEVLQLLDVDVATFKKPKFVRAVTKEYKFTKTDRLAIPEKWWTVGAEKAYIPALSAGAEPLKKKLTDMGILGTRVTAPSKDNPVITILRQVRARLGQPSNLHPLVAVLVVLLLTKLRK